MSPDLAEEESASIQVNDDALENLEDALLFQFDVEDNGIRTLDDSKQFHDSVAFLWEQADNPNKTLPSSFMELLRDRYWITNIKSK